MSTYNRETRAVTLDLRVEFPVKTLAGETVYMDIATICEACPEVIEQSMLRVLNDGIGAKDLTDTERLAKIRKRLDSWMKGQFRIVERGDASVTLMREALHARLEKAMNGPVKDSAFADFQRDSLIEAKMPAPEKGKAIPIEQVCLARVTLQNPKAKPEELAKLADAMMAELETEGRAIADARSATLAKLDVKGITV